MRKLFAILCLCVFAFGFMAGEKRIVGARVNNQIMLLRVDLANYTMDASTDGVNWSAVSGTSGAAMLTGAAFSGNVSVSGTFTALGTVSVPNNVFALSKLAQISTGSILGNVSGSSGNVSPLSASDIKTLIGNVTTSTAGLMSGTDKAKVDGLAAVAVSGSYSDLSNKPSNATTFVAGLMSGTDKAKVDGLAAVAVSGSYSDLSNRPSNATTSVAGLMSGTDKAKLDGLVSGYKGFFATESALKTAHPSGASGDYAIVGETGIVWAWTGSAWTATSIVSLPWSAITDKPSIPSRAVQYYTGTVADDGTITLDNSVAVSALAVGDLVQITSANATRGIAAGDLFRKNADSATVSVPDPLKVNVLGNYSGSGTYIHWNPYTLQSGNGSGRLWMSSNNTFYVGYRRIGGYNGWQIYYGSTVYASAVDDGSHNPWDPSLTWETGGNSGSANIYVEEGASNQTVTNNICQFIKIYPYNEATTSVSGLMSSSDKTKLDRLSVDAVASSESSVAASYTADWNTATIHRIKTAASIACALTVQNIPLGKSLMIRVDNTAAGSVTFNSAEVVPSSNTSVVFLTFVNITGSVEPKK